MNVPDVPRRPRLLIVSAVLPFPRRAGQNQRVYYTLRAARELFHLTFLTVADAARIDSMHAQLGELCEETIVLPSVYASNPAKRAWHRVLGALFTLRTGLKLSNYVVGQLELAPARVAAALDAAHFDCVLFEYWHAWQTVEVFRARGIPCVLDMHDVLWQSYARQLTARRGVPGWWKQRAIAAYRSAEEAAWQQFNALIAINAAECEYARKVVGGGKRIFYAPMGTDLAQWPYSWQPAQPPRIVYYGGLGSVHNQQDALRCYERIMPLIWEQHPQAELWLVGSNPPPALRALPAKDPRVMVTGFVECAQDILRTMTAVLCPWSGTYGFRSRLIEAMALGVPVVATPDAVYGMDMVPGQGLLLEAADDGLAKACISLIENADQACEHSQLARRQVEQKYSYEATYGRFAQELLEFTQNYSPLSR